MIKVISLVENTSKIDNITPQHGLSLYIEALGHKILFDMGQDDLFLINAQKLGVDIKDINIAVISHGHYDHGGGLKSFLSVNSKAKVYINHRAFYKYYNGEKYIGLDPLNTYTDRNRLVLTDDMTVIDNGLELYTHNDKEKKYTQEYSGLSKLVGSKLVPDDFLHEQCLCIQDDECKVVFSGCSHKGILNIADWSKADAIVGGFHFSKLPCDDTLAYYGQALLKYDAKFITCHCTGEAQYEFLKKHMKDRLSYLSCGQTLKL